MWVVRRHTLPDRRSHVPCLPQGLLVRWQLEANALFAGLLRRWWRVAVPRVWRRQQALAARGGTVLDMHGRFVHIGRHGNDTHDMHIVSCGIQLRRLEQANPLRSWLLFSRWGREVSSMWLRAQVQCGWCCLVLGLWGRPLHNRWHGDDTHVMQAVRGSLCQRQSHHAANAAYTAGPLRHVRCGILLR